MAEPTLVILTGMWWVVGAAVWLGYDILATLPDEVSPVKLQMRAIVTNRLAGFVHMEARSLSCIVGALSNSTM